jgi:hypothetical protein
MRARKWGVVCAVVAAACAEATVARADTATFTSKFAEQTFTVPAGVSSIHVVAIGARGGTGEMGAAGGFGAQVSADMTVTPGDVLYVEVGSDGFNGGLCKLPPFCLNGAGGFNGGGNAGGGDAQGGGGGGATDVRVSPRSGAGSLASRVIVAAGGGGGGAATAGFSAGGTGGAAGVAGGTGSLGTGGGAAGTLAGGGAGGVSAGDGTFGIGGGAPGAPRAMA